MRNPVKERASLVARHDFDSLSTHSAIEVRAARYDELATLTDMARRLVPGVQITEPALRSYLAFDPECILSFSHTERLLGAIAFLVSEQTRTRGSHLRRDLAHTTRCRPCLPGAMTRYQPPTSGQSLRRVAVSADLARQPCI